jgi:hypothetical protein
MHRVVGSAVEVGAYFQSIGNSTLSCRVVVVRHADVLNSVAVGMSHISLRSSSPSALARFFAGCMGLRKSARR